VQCIELHECIVIFSIDEPHVDSIHLHYDIDKPHLHFIVLHLEAIGNYCGDFFNPNINLHLEDMIFLLMPLICIYC